MDEIVTPLDVLQIKGQKWHYRGRELTKPEIDNLKSEADLIARTALWKLLIAEGKYHAQHRAIIEADVLENEKAVEILRQAHAFHKVVVLFEKFINNVGAKSR